MKTLTFASKEEAEARSRAEWETVLGRPKRAEDVTEFYFAVEGASVIVPEQDEARLSKAESTSLRALTLDSGEAEILDGFEKV
jgi:uncharacterized cupin superfamily protein